MDNEALALWQEYFQKAINPLSEGLVMYCSFCLAEVWEGDGDEKHRSDCIYIRAKQLVEKGI